MQNFAAIKWWLIDTLTCKVNEQVLVKFTCKAIIKLLCLFCLYSLQLETKAQNLVQDSSFENYYRCPTNLSQTDKLRFWNTPLSQGGSADYYNTCAVNTVAHVPINYIGNENAASGNGYLGLFLKVNNTGVDNYREYIEGELTDSLIKDVNYIVSFKYSLADDCGFVTNSFGIFFENNKKPYGDYVLKLPFSPQLINTKLLNNKIGWEKISFNYKAKGGEKNIILGNFQNDSSTNLIFINNGNFNASYIFLDDISIYQGCYTPKIFLGNDTLLCNGKKLTLNSKSSFSTYLWHDGDTSSSYVVNKEGLYWVKVTNSCGSSYDTIYVKYSSPPTLNLGNDTTICNNKTLELKPNVHQVNYLWQDWTTDSNYTVTKNGIYALKVSNFCGEANDSIKVSFEENPTVKLGNDTILCDDKELLIQLPKKYNYVWQDKWQDTFYNVTKTGLYKVTAFNYCGSITDEIQVSFIDCKCYQYYIPNAFTPKNDGINDWFYPVTNCEPEKFSFSIYNRWGSEVFYTNNHKEKWDGKFNGKECQADVYFYTLNYQFPLSTAKSIKGTVTLIR